MTLNGNENFSGFPKPFHFVLVTKYEIHLLRVLTFVDEVLKCYRKIENEMSMQQQTAYHLITGMEVG